MKIGLPNALIFTGSLSGTYVLANDKSYDSTRLWIDNAKRSDKARRLNLNEEAMTSGNRRRLRSNSNMNDGQQRRDVEYHLLDALVDMNTPSDTKRILGEEGEVYDSEMTLEEERRAVSQHRVASDASEISLRIIGGNQSEVGEFPYFVDLFGCGGSLIAPNAVLTAAHCNKFRGQEVIVGGYQRMNATYGGQTRIVVSAVIHPDFNHTTGEWDFQLLRLDSPVNQNTQVGLALNDFADVPFDGERLTVLGLGLFSLNFTQGEVVPDFLHDVEVYAMSSEECRNNTYYEGRENEECMFCAGVDEGGKDACGGDSGGPIVIRDDTFSHIQVGVVSWGLGCGEADYPGVYSRVSSAYTWIKDVVCGDWMGTGHLCDDYIHRNTTASSPGNDTSCVDLEIDLLTDDYGKEVDIILFDDVTGGLLWNKRDFLNNETYQFNACVQKDGCYTLDVYDTLANGLSNPGYIQGKFDGQELFKQNEYGLRFVHQFGTGC